MLFIPMDDPDWIVKRRCEGEALVRRETGKGVAEFTRKQLVEVLRDCSYARPPRLHVQDKRDLVAHVQRWVMSEREGGSILVAMKRQAHG